MNCPPARSLLLSAALSPLFLITAYGQEPLKHYDQEWDRVIKLAKKNRPGSAFLETRKIYEQAKKDQQDAQIIKALVYMSGLQSENRENNELFSVREIEKEINESREPATSLLKSILAEVYWNYYQQNRWKIYNRSETDRSKFYDIDTWAAEDFHKKISELYLESTRDEKLLQQVKPDPFDAIIVKGNTRSLRPTLYDLLAHRALEYFKNDERDIKRPAYAFEINPSEAFGPAEDFIKLKISTNDSLSLYYKALLIYQKLIAFHLLDDPPGALIDADIKRIEFVNSRSVHPDKEKLYLRAIEQIARQYDGHPVAAQAWYLMASYYDRQAATYTPFGDTTHHYERVKARDICEKVLRQKDESEGWVNCYNLLNRINNRQVQFNIEKVNIPNQPFRALIGYSNVPLIYLRLIRKDESLKKDLKNPAVNYWASIIKASPVKSWEQQLPSPRDLQPHKTEIKIDGLPPGEYVLLGGTARDFMDDKTILFSRDLYVSNISYVSMEDDYFIVDRDNGQPLAGAAVQFWEQKYDYKLSKYITEKGNHYRADSNGFFRRVKAENNNIGYSRYSFMPDITYQEDRLFVDEFQQEYYHYRNNNDRLIPMITTSVFLFTDRSIYRPGQTVYFKGIAVTTDPEHRTGGVEKDFDIIVFLRDANERDIDSLILKGNEFGSFNGKFRLPSTGMNGAFSIHTKKGNGYTSLRVEEYKRPTFFVEYEPVKGAYKVKDKIKVTGIAKAYAGNNIDGATVKYRVVRKPRFLYAWLFRRSVQPATGDVEIAHGEIKTDEEGKFNIEFNAIPDLSIEMRFSPVFDYKVYTDITDISGETRSGEKTVSAGYQSLLLRATIPGQLPVDSLGSLMIRTENMNGEFEPAAVNVMITKLKEENRLIRERYWERPDQFVMTKEEYIKNFPVDEYDNESDYRNWEKGERVFEKTDSVRGNGQWTIGNTQFASGFYVVEISTRDKNGEPVKDIQYIELYDDKNNRLSHPKYFWAQGGKPIEPGEITTIQLGTAADNVFVIQTLDKGVSAGENSFFKLNNEKRTLLFPATENDRGGYGLVWLLVKHNRFYQHKETVVVPWTNKDLSVEYLTYRDKTLPGSEEKWKVKISGYKKEKVAAEMLASMYDVSLDQFYPGDWSKPDPWPYYYNSRIWAGRSNFEDIRSFDRNLTELKEKKFEKRYDIFLASYVFSPDYRYSTEPLWWLNPLDYIYSEQRNPRLMRLPKPVFASPEEARVAMRGKPVLPDADGDGITDQFDEEQTPIGCPVNERGIRLDSDGDGIPDCEDKKNDRNNEPPATVRKNFNETAFFFPDLVTDSTGTIEFSFTMPESLTKWKFMALAHTMDAAFGSNTKELVTQKQLMVQPNTPRFLRETDKIEFSSKIVNLSAKEIKGEAVLQLIDATTNEPVDGLFKNRSPKQSFALAPGKSQTMEFPFEIPSSFNKALTWRIVAKAGAFNDGEENSLPVLSNRILVTETMPISMKTGSTKNFSFDKLLNSGKSGTLKHYQLSIEYASQPTWYAIQSIPYLMEYPYECAEQTWNRYYANSLATMIANVSPRIKEVFKKWADSSQIPPSGGGGALMSSLQKNEELKSILLEETPWVLQAKNENDQKRNIALLFDMVRMNNELDKAYEKLKQMQSSNGGFAWFRGGPDDRYITQYIVTGIGHLKKLNAWTEGQPDKLERIVSAAIPYLDKKMKEGYDLIKKDKEEQKDYTPGYLDVQYLYMRSFFSRQEMNNAVKTAYNYFTERAQKTWVKQNKYMQGMIALALARTGDKKTADDILISLKETAVINEESGMYWKDQRSGWFWYEAPVETQALLIEAFREIGKDTKTVDDLRTWLLKNKQTNNWKTTKATAEACYALLLQGTAPIAIGGLSNEPVVEIKLGNTTTIRSTEAGQEAGTGYFKKTIEGNKVTPQMGNISVTVGSSQIPLQGDLGGWGSLYWQYFEDLDKITTASTPLKLVKKLFVEKNTDRGPVITPVNDGDILKVGDKIKVRVELRVDRDMEYVHMKDMRASALEPVNVLSSYKWQDGLGYYESTKDASTNFFFNYLRKGAYVFEYPLFVTHAGNFSNGITTIQCMYAPEFSSHSEGIRINVE